MPSWWFLRVKPSEELTPDEGYDSYFSADGTEGTTAGDLYRKDANGNVVHVGGTSGGGGGGTYTDEQAQDAVGRILFDTSTVDFTYNDPGNTITAVVPANAVTNTVLADMAGGTIKGRPVGSAGDPQDLNPTQVKALISFAAGDITDFTEAAQDVVGAALRDSSSVNLAYNDAANTITGQVQTGGITTAMIAANAVTAAQLAADSVTTVKIAADAVSNDKLDNMPAKTFKANATSSSANPTDVTTTAAKSMLAYTAPEVGSVPFGTVTATNVQDALQALYSLITAGGGGGGSPVDPGTDFNVAGGNVYFGGAYWNPVTNGSPTFNPAVVLSDNSDVTYIVGSASTHDGGGPSVGDRYYVQFSISDVVVFQPDPRVITGFSVTARCSGPRASTLTVQNLAGPAISGIITGHYTSTTFAKQDITIGPFTRPGGGNWSGGDLQNLQLAVALDVDGGYHMADAGHVPINTNVGPTISDPQALKIYKLTITPTYI